MDSDPKYDQALSIVEKIIDDFTDRRGLRQEWEQIDMDIKEEIRKKWVGIVYDGL